VPTEIKHYRPGVKRLLIVFHSVTGSTRQMAPPRPRRGDVEIAVTLRHARDAEPADVWARRLHLRHPGKSGGDLRADEGFLRPTYYPALDRISRAALCHADLRGQRTARTPPPDRPHPLPGWRLRAIADPLLGLHACSDAGGDFWRRK